eukprot:105586-Hanusia_phi.AAC.1
MQCEIKMMRDVVRGVRIDDIIHEIEIVEEDLGRMRTELMSAELMNNAINTFDTDIFGLNIMEYIIMEECEIDHYD